MVQVYSNSSKSNITFNYTLFSDERHAEEAGVQRRRSNSEGLANFAGRSRTVAIENCVCDDQPSSENVAVVASNENPNSSSQHRSIPSTVCATLSSTDGQPVNQKAHQPVKRICQVHKS